MQYHPTFTGYVHPKRQSVCDMLESAGDGTVLRTNGPRTFRTHFEAPRQSQNRWIWRSRVRSKDVGALGFFACVLLLSWACSCNDQDHQIQEADSSIDPWPEGVPKEELSPVDCPAERCFVIEPGTTLCALDPAAMEDGPFAGKSRIILPEGAYPLGQDNTIPTFPIELETALGRASLTHEGNLRYRYSPEKSSPEGKLAFYERLSVIDAPFRGQQGAEFLVSISTIHLDIWPEDHFHLGDSTNTWWWYAAGRGMTLQIQNPTSLFALPKTPWWIYYVPCGMPDMPDDRFVFDFSDEQNIEVIVRSITHVGTIGHYGGVLVAATGTFDGKTIEVRDPYKLAFIGSTDSAVRSTPILVVRFQEHGEYCGLIFDPRKYGPNPSGSGTIWTGWLAYKLTCDDQQGEEVPLEGFLFPPKYQPPA